MQEILFLLEKNSWIFWKQVICFLEIVKCGDPAVECLSIDSTSQKNLLYHNCFFGKISERFNIWLIWQV